MRSRGRSEAASVRSFRAAVADGPFARLLPRVGGCSALLLALLLVPRFALARDTISAGDVEVSFDDTRQSAAVNSGALPRIVRLENHSHSQRHVAVDFSAAMPVVLVSSVERRVVLAPGERRFVTLPVPAGRFGTLGVHVEETGALSSRSGFYSAPTSNEGSILVVGRREDIRAFYSFLGAPAPKGEDEDSGDEAEDADDAEQEADAKADGATQGAAKKEAPPSLPDPDRALVPLAIAEMPDLLAGYAGFRAIYALGGDWNALTAAQKTALEDYVLTGGQLFFGPGIAAASPRLEQWQAGPESVDHLGWGDIYLCRAKADCLSALTTVRSPLVHIPTTSDWSPRHRGRADINPRDRMLRSVGRVPLNGFLAIILLFAIAIGPGSLYVARRRGRHHLLLLIPAIACTTCGGISAYAVSADGFFTVHAESQSVTFLDGQNHRSATLAVVAWLASLPRESQHFPKEVADTFELLGNSASLDWTDGLALSGDIIPARRYVEQATLSVRPARERLLVTDGHVENALGGRIEWGIVNWHGTLFELGEIAGGAQGSLKPLKEDNAAEAPEGEDGLCRMKMDELDERFTHVWTRLCAPLQEDEFVVILSDSSFVPTGGIAPQWHPSLNAVRGRIAP